MTRREKKAIYKLIADKRDLACVRMEKADKEGNFLEYEYQKGIADCCQFFLLKHLRLEIL